MKRIALIIIGVLTLTYTSILYGETGAIDIPAISHEAISQNFDITIPPGDLVKPDEALPTPEPVFSQSDFSKNDYSEFPFYSRFAYLNEITTKAIAGSNSTVEIAIYSITLKEMPEALINAKNRGVKVRMIIDESHIYPKPYAAIKELIESGINIRSLRGTRDYGVMHNKIGIFDKTLITAGSYNWTFGATFQSYENMILTTQPEYVKGYVKYFDWMWSKARDLSHGPSPAVPEGHYGTPPQSAQNLMSFNGVQIPYYLFSPGSQSQERLSEIINACKKSLDVVTYTFSSPPLAEALVAAKNRGVKVRFMMDKQRGKDSVLAKYLVNNGVEFRWRVGRNGKGAMHSKYAILDGQILETGSFNWTANASLNSFENIMFVNDSYTLGKYQSKFDFLYSEAEIPTIDDFQAVEEPRDDSGAVNSPGKGMNFADISEVMESD